MPGTFQIIQSTNQPVTVTGAPGGAAGIQGPPGTPGIAWPANGVWSALTAYVVGDAVTVGGTSYRAILNHTNHIPPNATYWAVLAAKGDDGEDGAGGGGGVIGGSRQYLGVGS